LFAQVKVEIGSLGWGLMELGEAAIITAKEEEEGSLEECGARKLETKDQTETSQQRTVETEAELLGPERGVDEDSVQYVTDALQEIKLGSTSYAESVTYKPLIEEVVGSDGSSETSCSSEDSSEVSEDGSEGRSEDNYSKDSSGDSSKTNSEDESSGNSSKTSSEDESSGSDSPTNE
jgi:hypothetical protein